MSSADIASGEIALKFAAEVLRLGRILNCADDLVDVWETRAEGDEHSPAEQSAYRITALELRAALEGRDE